MKKWIPILLLVSINAYGDKPTLIPNHYDNCDLCESGTAGNVTLISSPAELTRWNHTTGVITFPALDQAVRKALSSLSVGSSNEGNISFISEGRVIIELEHASTHYVPSGVIIYDCRGVRFPIEPDHPRGFVMSWDSKLHCINVEYGFMTWLEAASHSGQK